MIIGATPILNFNTDKCPLLLPIPKTPIVYAEISQRSVARERFRAAFRRDLLYSALALDELE